MKPVDVNRRITADDVRNLLNYNKVTGTLTWRKSRYLIKVGSVAGSVNHDGYIHVAIDKKRYLAHRLIWLWMTGKWPECIIDHIDGIKGNNAWNNLREATLSMNSQNQRTAQAHSRDSFLGITKMDSKWMARILVNGKRICLGRYFTPQEAHQVYLEAKRKLHEGCTI